MRYLALGDSISIGDYTGVENGGAVSQFARLIRADAVEDCTHDGQTTEGVLKTLPEVTERPDVITLTAGGNDFLLSSYWIEIDRETADGNLTQATVEDPLDNLRNIAEVLNSLCCPLVILNTIYDPTDGNDSLAEELGVSPDFRRVFNALNNGLRSLAKEYGFACCDLEKLFVGHGIHSQDTWITQQIEPNHAGATAIAQAWFKLFRVPALTRYPT